MDVTLSNLFKDNMYDMANVDDSATEEEQFNVVRSIMTHMTTLSWIISEHDRLFQIGRNTYEFVLALSKEGLEVDGFDFFKNALQESFEEISKQSGLEFPIDLDKDELFKAAIGLLWVQRLSDFLEIKSRPLYKDVKSGIEDIRKAFEKVQEEE